MRANTFPVLRKAASAEFVCRSTERGLAITERVEVKCTAQCLAHRKLCVVTVTAVVVSIPD